MIIPSLIVLPFYLFFVMSTFLGQALYHILLILVAWVLAGNPVTGFPCFFVYELIFWGIVGLGIDMFLRPEAYGFAANPLLGAQDNSGKNANLAMPGDEAP